MIIVDTSAWIYLFEKKPHGKASKQVRHFYENNRKPLAVTDLIIEETHKWLVHHGFPGSMALEILHGFVSESFAKILPIDPQDRVEAKKLVEKYLDQSISYTDAITVAVMKRCRIKQIVSFDSDFDLFREIERHPDCV